MGRAPMLAGGALGLATGSLGTGLVLMYLQDTLSAAATYPGAFLKTGVLFVAMLVGAVVTIALGFLGLIAGVKLEARRREGSTDG